MSNGQQVYFGGDEARALEAMLSYLKRIADGVDKLNAQIAQLVAKDTGAAPRQ